MSNGTIPNLQTPKNLNCGEGATDLKHYAKPTGSMNAVMLFVGFPDAPGVDLPQDVADHLLGKGQFEALYQDQSAGQLSFDITVMAKLGWKPMPRRSTDYGELDDQGGVKFETSDQQRTYIADAVAAFSPAEVDFDDVGMVFVVAPKEAALSNSPAFPVAKGFGVKVGNTEIRHAVTLGRDSYKNSFINLVHEVGHLFGLPDLYPAGMLAEDSKAGCWGIMSDIFRASGFLGWHRHKNGWLDASRKTYVAASGTSSFTLAPLSAASGLAMLVFPIDDRAKPSKVFVVEVAQPVAGLDGTPGEEGVLIYTVDATKESGATPVEVLPRLKGHDDNMGNLFQAPFGPGDDSGPLTDGGATLRLSVLRANGAGFDVEVAYTSP
jgi:M6 family metalloprotease-like protein